MSSDVTGYGIRNYLCNKKLSFYIGSAEGVNHLHIQDKTVSREHAVILEDIYEGDGQGYILRDMGSTNGTWLNGKKIKEKIRNN